MSHVERGPDHEHHPEPYTDPDERNDRAMQERVDDLADHYMKLGRMDALTQLLNELRAYGYPADFQRFVAAKLAKESGMELPA